MLTIPESVQTISIKKFQPSSYKDAGEKYLQHVDFRNIQQSSYYSFIDNTLNRLFSNVFENDKYKIEFMDFYLDWSNAYEEQIAIKNKLSIEYSLYATVKVTIKDTNKIKQNNIPNQTIVKKVLITKFPKLIDNHFIVNGIYKCAINHLEQGYCPFIKVVKDGTKLVNTLTFSSSHANLYVQEKNKVHEITVALPYVTHLSKNLQGIKNFNIINALKDLNLSESEILEIIGPHPVLMLQAQNSTASYEQHFDLIRTGFIMDEVCRTNLNQHLSFTNLLIDKVAAETVHLGPVILINKGEKINFEKAELLQESGIQHIAVLSNGIRINIFNNGMVNAKQLLESYNIPLDYLPESFRIKVHDDITDDYTYYYLPIQKEIFEQLKSSTNDLSYFKELLQINYAELAGYCLTKYDTIALINYYANHLLGVFPEDDRDSLAYKRVANIKDIFEDMILKRLYSTTPAHCSLLNQLQNNKSAQNITNSDNISKNVAAEFQLNLDLDCPPEKTITKQIMINHLFQSEEDINNTISQCAHTRKVTATTMEGRGGVAADTSDLTYRSLNPSYCGRLGCIETPEGKMIGLVRYITTLAKVNAGGEILAPFFRVDKDNKVIDYATVYFLPYSIEMRYGRCISPTIATKDEVEIKLFKRDKYFKSVIKPLTYMEKEFYVAEAEMLLHETHTDSYQILIKKKDWFVDENHILIYKGHGENIMATYNDVDFVVIKGEHVISPVASVIPLMEYNENNRNMMGGFHGTQAISTLRREVQPTFAPITVSNAPKQAEGICVAPCIGRIVMIDSKAIYIQNFEDEDMPVEVVPYLTGKASPEKTFIYSKPIVYVGEYVNKGQVIADNSTTVNGEVANGFSKLIGYASWDGYNYEDAILVSDSLVKNGYGISFHMRTYTISISSETYSVGNKKIPKECLVDTNDLSHKAVIPKRLARDRRYDTRGILKESAFVKPGEIIGGCIIKKERQGGEFRDTYRSVKYDQDEEGYILSVTTRTDTDPASHSSKTNYYIDITVIYSQTYRVGDKSSGQHGNKGVISKIMREADMPYLPDGTPLDICLASLGVPSRMNLAQFITGLQGLLYRFYGLRFEVSPLDYKDSDKLFKALNIFDGKGKIQLYDGRTGDPIYYTTFVTYNYLYKSEHTASDKIYGRRTGNYTLIGQPPKSKTNTGGQRLGEMEGDNIKSQGAIYTAMELQTCKSDDPTGRDRFKEAQTNMLSNGLGNINIKGNTSVPMRETFSILKAQGNAYEFFDADGKEIDVTLDFVNLSGTVSPITLDESIKLRKEILVSYDNPFKKQNSKEELVMDETDDDNEYDDDDYLKGDEEDEEEDEVDALLSELAQTAQPLTQSTIDDIVKPEGLSLEELNTLETLYAKNFLGIQSIGETSIYRTRPMTGRLILYLNKNELDYSYSSKEMNYILSLLPVDENYSTYITASVQEEYIEALINSICIIDFDAKENEALVDLFETGLEKEDINLLEATVLVKATTMDSLNANELESLRNLLDTDFLISISPEELEEFLRLNIVDIKTRDLEVEEVLEESVIDSIQRAEEDDASPEYDDEDEDVYYDLVDN